MHLAELRDKEISLKIARKIKEISKDLGNIKIMNFCGTHEWTITHYGLRYLMPENLELVAGPGCPVCITPAQYVDAAVRLAMEGVRVLTFGDSYRLMGSRRSGLPKSLEEAKEKGASVEIVYGMLDAIRMVRDGKESVFLSVGFETTAPATLNPIRSGEIPSNLSLIVAHRLTPPVMRYVLERFPGSPIRGVIAPGHVSTIIGSSAWEFVAEEYGIPVAVSGFEPVDVLLSVLEIVRQIARGEAKLFNEYSRVVSYGGNERALRVIASTTDVVDAAWRGIGVVPKSGLVLKEELSEFDALKRYGLSEPSEWRDDSPPGCRCAEITLGIAKPTDCPLFMRTCTPQRPYGPCMVSIEGTCLIWAKYGGGEFLRGLLDLST
ncbi:MAG: hydrogenase formation protein HypD [Candidatus Korarchaeum sp.]